MSRWNDPKLEAVCERGAKQMLAMIITGVASPTGDRAHWSQEDRDLFDACFWEKVGEMLLAESQFLRRKLGLKD